MTASSPNVTIYVGNDNLIEIIGLKNVATGAYVNTATAQVTLKTPSGTNISGETWPLPMPFVASSNGDYRATLQDTLTLTPGRSVVAHIDVTGDSLQAHWERTLTVKARN